MALLKCSMHHSVSLMLWGTVHSKSAVSGGLQKRPRNQLNDAHQKKQVRRHQISRPRYTANPYSVTLPHGGISPVMFYPDISDSKVIKKPDIGLKLQRQNPQEYYNRTEKEERMSKQDTSPLHNVAVETTNVPQR